MKDTLIRAGLMIVVILCFALLGLVVAVGVHIYEHLLLAFGEDSVYKALYGGVMLGVVAFLMWGLAGELQVYLKERNAKRTGEPRQEDDAGAQSEAGGSQESLARD